jgi:hypothetical protein
MQGLIETAGNHNFPVIQTTIFRHRFLPLA